MNPFTRFLSQWSANKPFEEFIQRWDQVEMVMVGVYRKKMTLEEAQPYFAETWPWLCEHYHQWAGDLRPYWQKTISGGHPTKADPFQMLIDLPNPEAIIGNWTAMQHLPSAREALNSYILHK